MEITSNAFWHTYSCHDFLASLKLLLHVDQASFEELDRILSMEARKFHAAATRFVCQLQCVGERIQFEFIEFLGAFLDALFLSVLKDNDLHGKVKPFLDNLKSDIHLMKTRLSLTECSKSA